MLPDDFDESHDGIEDFFEDQLQDAIETMQPDSYWIGLNLGPKYVYTDNGPGFRVHLNEPVSRFQFNIIFILIFYKF